MNKIRTPVSSCRYDNSLGKVTFYIMDAPHICQVVPKHISYSSGLLTKKFIHLIKEADDGVLDLNKAADMLGVSSVCHYPYGCYCYDVAKCHLNF